jgi:cysteinyl-tRNA synthetase
MKTKTALQRSAAWSVTLVALLVAVASLSACSHKPKPTSAEIATTKLDDLETKVRAVVKDDARAAKVIAAVEGMRTLLTAQTQALAAHDRRITALLTDYAASDADLRSEFDAFNAGRNERARRAVDALSQMRAATTPEEWSALDRARRQALNAESNAARKD